MSACCKLRVQIFANAAMDDRIVYVAVSLAHFSISGIVKALLVKSPLCKLYWVLPVHLPFNKVEGGGFWHFTLGG